jgi:hypothetical protein
MGRLPPYYPGDEIPQDISIYHSTNSGLNGMIYRLRRNVMSNAEASRAKTAGILSIIAGALFIIGMGFGAFILWALFDVFSRGASNSNGLSITLIPIVILPAMLFGVMAIIGGIAAIQHRSWALALTGSICSIICVWYLGIPSIILLVKAKKAFFTDNASDAPIVSADQ